MPEPSDRPLPLDTSERDVDRIIEYIEEKQSGRS
jgi:hypothetical protein